MLTMDKLVSGDKQRTTNTYGLKKVVLLNIKIFGFLFFLEANFVVFLFLKELQAYGSLTLLAFIFLGHLLGQLSLIFYSTNFLCQVGHLCEILTLQGYTHIIFFYTRIQIIIFKQKLYCEGGVVAPSSKGVHDFRFDLWHTITIMGA